MENITQLVALAKAHAWTTLLLHGALALILLAVARRSQIDSWAECNPKIAGVLKILRGLGIDPWLVLSGLSLLIRGRLPATKDDSKKPPSGGAGGLVGFAICVIAALAIGCASIPPQFKDVANEAGARTAVMTACSLGHSYDGKVSAATAVVEICSKQEYAEPWIELTKQIADLVKAQRKGLARPAKEEPVEPTPAPAPPPKPIEEPAIVSKPATEA
jgi:hypothetical protein